MNKVIIIRGVEDNSIFDCGNQSPVANPIANKNKKYFEAYKEYHTFFYISLNTDLAPVGFLEYLDKILTAAKKYDIILTCKEKSEEVNCEIIQEYIETELGKENDKTVQKQQSFSF